MRMELKIREKLKEKLESLKRSKKNKKGLKKTIITLKKVAKKVIKSGKGDDLNRFSSYLRGEGRLPDIFVPRNIYAKRKRRW